MKKRTSLLPLAFLFTIHVGFAQIEFEEDIPNNGEKPVLLDINVDNKASVSNSDESMALGIKPVMILQLEIADNKLVKNAWEDYLKEYGGKTKKAKGGNGEELTTEAEIVGINGVNKLDIYAKAQTAANGNTELLVWFNLGEEFLGPDRKQQYDEAEKLLLKFAHEAKKEHTANELKESEKRLKDLNGDLNKLVRQNEGYHKDIEDAEKRIEQAKENIVKNNEQQLDTNKKIELQKMLVEEIDRRLKEMKKL